MTGGEERLTEGGDTKPGCDGFSSQDGACAGNIVFLTLASLFALERSNSIIMTSTGRIADCVVRLRRYASSIVSYDFGD